MWYCNIQIQVRTQTLPQKITGTHNPNWQQLQAVGWRYLDNLPAPPEGQREADAVYSQAAEPEHAIAVYSYEEIPKPFPQPGTLVPRLNDEGDQIGTSRLLADSENNIIGVIDTASPQHPEEEQIAEFKAKVAAKKAKKAKKAEIVSDASANKAAALAATSVPVLRKNVAALSDIVDKLIELSGI